MRACMGLVVHDFRFCFDHAFDTPEAFEVGRRNHGDRGLGWFGEGTEELDFADVVRAHFDDGHVCILLKLQ